VVLRLHRLDVMHELRPALEAVLERERVLGLGQFRPRPLDGLKEDRKL
jgi:hypothetical protein